MEKWLDKLQNGGQFEGLTNKGFTKNGAWGGPAQSGTKFPNILSELKQETAQRKQPSKEQRQVVTESTKLKPIEQVKKAPKEYLKEKYYNPEKREDITSGDERVDFLYNNPWLLDTPIVGDYLKEQAKNLAERSGGVQRVGNIDRTLAKKPDYTGSYGEEKSSLLDQYFSETPLYPKSKYKPTSDYLEFLPSYSVKPKDINREQFVESINSFIADNPEAYKEFSKSKKSIYKPYNESSPATDIVPVDLGGHKVGMAYDEERKLPYMSISDAWDFEPTNYATKWTSHERGNEKEKKALEDKAFMQSYLMHKAGNPFKVYDRFYFDPKTKEYIPDEKLKSGGGLKGQNGADMYGNPMLSSERTNMGLDRSYYDPRLNKINYDELTRFMPEEEKDKIESHENFHAWQNANDRTNFDMVHNPNYAFQERLQRKPQLPTTDEVWHGYHNRKPIEVDTDIRNLKQNFNQFSFVPEQILYDKIVDAEQYTNPRSLEGEAKLYEDTGEYPKSKNGGWLDNYQDGGDIPVSSQGVYDYPEQEVIVPTLDGKITMNQVKYPIFGIDELGNKKLMKPNKDYQFPGKVIHEIPKLKSYEKDRRKNS